ARQTKVMEWHEDAVGANQSQPEMYFTQLLAHHPAGHLGEPKIRSGKHAEDRGHTHHHVEVTDHEVSRVEININRGLSEEEATHTAAHEHGDKAQREQRRRRDW